jgi:hypothetical protein
MPSYFRVSVNYRNIKNDHLKLPDFLSMLFCSKTGLLENYKKADNDMILKYESYSKYYINKDKFYLNMNCNINDPEDEKMIYHNVYNSDGFTCSQIDGIYIFNYNKSDAICIQKYDIDEVGDFWNDRYHNIKNGFFNIKDKNVYMTTQKHNHYQQGFLHLLTLREKMELCIVKSMEINNLLISIRSNKYIIDENNIFCTENHIYLLLYSIFYHFIRFPLYVVSIPVFFVVIPSLVIYLFVKLLILLSLSFLANERGDIVYLKENMLADFKKNSYLFFFFPFLDDNKDSINSSCLLENYKIGYSQNKNNIININEKIIVKGLKIENLVDSFCYYYNINVDVLFCRSIPNIKRSIFKKFK